MPSPYETIISLLNEHKVPYQEFDHDPILSYENAEREKAKFGWSGVESKNVFMKGNDDRYYLCVTVQGKRVDMKKFKEGANEKVVGARRIFYLGVGSLIFVPIFRALTNLPPFMGMILGLGVMWVVIKLN